MNTSTSSNSKGFTIIEVVLVLAIAGLIFLLVFLAVPALQRSQRDTQRRQDASRFISQIQAYQSNNRGAVPDVAATAGCVATAPKSIGCFVDNYLQTNDVWNDPSTAAEYAFTPNTAVFSATTTPGTWQYNVNVQCDGENFLAGGGNRRVAVRMKLEGAGVYCVNN